MISCRICETYIAPFMSFGKMPIANGFLTPDTYDSEYFFELAVGYCSNCQMVQLIEQPDRTKMFHDQYAYYSSISKRMREHFQKMVADIFARYPVSDNPFIVEIGSNDGILLQNIAQKNMHHLGVEPSKNVAQVAQDKGIQTINEFFDRHVAQNIASKHGQADIIFAANVMCHIPDIHSVVSGIKYLLKPKGIFVFEDPYLPDIIDKISYDQIYDEHVFYFSLTSLSHIFNLYDLEIIHVIPQDVHGGSMRYVVAQKNAYRLSEALVHQKQIEDQKKLNHASTFEQLRQNINGSKLQLMALLNDLQKQTKRVIGYGATSKSTTVINYCGINSHHIEFISDTTPIKQGKFTPGGHIPVRPYQAFSNNYPDYALLFAWNHKAEIMANEDAFSNSGGKWIVYVPSIQIF
ncbi:MAG: class I SAM-dependent methyltransferase [Candidatus Magnetomorum sp.]|nr:class I SAM-dependent methyltransferase [Candidatus Magnetomorum sp.]